MKLSEAWKLCRLVSKEERNTIPISNRLVTSMDEGAVFGNGDGITIVIDGSDDIDEWLSNFQFKSNRLGFHHEFYNSAVEIYRTLHIPPSTNVTIIGHSRGGAIAQVLAYLINRPNIDVITFGSPKVANRVGIKKLKEVSFSHTRVRINGDPVDNVPPFLFGYSHYHTKLIKLKGIKGKLNHLAFGESLQLIE